MYNKLNAYVCNAAYFCINNITMYQNKFYKMYLAGLIEGKIENISDNT